MASRNDTYYILVVCDSSNEVVGTGAVIVERKFIHNLGLVGHIEDIAVAKNQQGKKLGLRIIQALDYVAEKVGCYKSILDCSEANEGFYVKCGFRRAGLEMAHYYEKNFAGGSMPTPDQLRAPAKPGGPRQVLTGAADKLVRDTN
jgi:GNAT superfamily N-acetyltransferase